MPAQLEGKYLLPLAIQTKWVLNMCQHSYFSVIFLSKQAPPGLMFKQSMTCSEGDRQKLQHLHLANQCHGYRNSRSHRGMEFPSWVDDNRNYSTHRKCKIQTMDNIKNPVITTQESLQNQSNHKPGFKHYEHENWNFQHLLHLSVEKNMTES